MDFCVLPFISVRRTTVFGPYLLWPNTDANWQEHMDADETFFLQMYRDRDGEPMAERASVLHRRDGQEVEHPEWVDVVAALSAVEWLTSQFGGDSDRWLFESWRKPPGTDDFVRVGKFTRNLTDSEYDRLAPDPYTHPRPFDVRSDSRFLTFFGTASGPRPASLFTALRHLYRVRRGAPYFGSAFDDIEALCSAFEAWVEAPITMPYADDSVCAHRTRDYVPKRAIRFLGGASPMAERLRRLTPDSIKNTWLADPLRRLRRSEFVAEAVVRALRELGVDARTLEHVRGLVARLYAVRNAYTHGGTPNRRLLLSADHQIGVIQLAIRVWEALLRGRVESDDIFKAFDLPRNLAEVFLEKEVHDALVELARGLTREIILAGIVADHGVLAQVRAAVGDIARVGAIPTQRHRGAGALRRAVRTIGLALSEVLLQLGDRRILNDGTTAMQVRQSITDIVAGPTRPDRIDTTIAGHLAGLGMTGPDAYDEHVDALTSGIQLYELVAILVRLQELVLGRSLS